MKIGDISSKLIRNNYKNDLSNTFTEEIIKNIFDISYNLTEFLNIKKFITLNNDNNIGIITKTTKIPVHIKNGSELKDIIKNIISKLYYGKNNIQQQQQNEDLLQKYIKLYEEIFKYYEYDVSVYKKKDITSLDEICDILKDKNIILLQNISKKIDKFSIIVQYEKELKGYNISPTLLYRTSTGKLKPFQTGEFINIWNKTELICFFTNNLQKKLPFLTLKYKRLNYNSNVKIVKKIPIDNIKLFDEYIGNNGVRKQLFENERAKYSKVINFIWSILKFCQFVHPIKPWFNSVDKLLIDNISKEIEKLINKNEHPKYKEIEILCNMIINHAERNMGIILHETEKLPINELKIINIGNKKCISEKLPIILEISIDLSQKTIYSVNVISNNINQCENIDNNEKNNLDIFLKNGYVTMYNSFIKYNAKEFNNSTKNNISKLYFSISGDSLETISKTYILKPYSIINGIISNIEIFETTFNTFINEFIKILSNKSDNNSLYMENNDNLSSTAVKNISLRKYISNESILECLSEIWGYIKIDNNKNYARDFMHILFNRLLIRALYPINSIEHLKIIKNDDISIEITKKLINLELNIYNTRIDVIKSKSTLKPNIDINHQYSVKLKYPIFYQENIEITPIINQNALNMKKLLKKMYTPFNKVNIIKDTMNSITGGKSNKNELIKLIDYMESHRESSLFLGQIISKANSFFDTELFHKSYIDYIFNNLGKIYNDDPEYILNNKYSITSYNPYIWQIDITCMASAISYVYQYLKDINKISSNNRLNIKYDLDKTERNYQNSIYDFKNSLLSFYGPENIIYSNNSGQINIFKKKSSSITRSNLFNKGNRNKRSKFTTSDILHEEILMNPDDEDQTLKIVNRKKMETYMGHITIYDSTESVLVNKTGKNLDTPQKTVITIEPWDNNDYLDSDREIIINGGDKNDTDDNKIINVARVKNIEFNSKTIIDTPIFNKRSNFSNIKNKKILDPKIYEKNTIINNNKNNIISLLDDNKDDDDDDEMEIQINNDIGDIIKTKKNISKKEQYLENQKKVSIYIGRIKEYVELQYELIIKMREPITNEYISKFVKKYIFTENDADIDSFLKNNINTIVNIFKTRKTDITRIKENQKKRKRIRNFNIDQLEKPPLKKRKISKETTTTAVITKEKQKKENIIIPYDMMMLLFDSSIFNWLKLKIEEHHIAWKRQKDSVLQERWKNSNFFEKYINVFCSKDGSMINLDDENKYFRQIKNSALNFIKYIDTLETNRTNISIDNELIKLNRLISKDINIFKQCFETNANSNNIEESMLHGSKKAYAFALLLPKIISFKYESKYLESTTDREELIKLVTSKRSIENLELYSKFLVVDFSKLHYNISEVFPGITLDIIRGFIPIYSTDGTNVGRAVRRVNYKIIGYCSVNVTSKTRKVIYESLNNTNIKTQFSEISTRYDSGENNAYIDSEINRQIKKYKKEIFLRKYTELSHSTLFKKKNENDDIISFAIFELTTESFEVYTSKVIQTFDNIHYDIFPLIFGGIRGNKKEQYKNNESKKQSIFLPDNYLFHLIEKKESNNEEKKLSLSLKIIARYCKKLKEYITNSGDEKILSINIEDLSWILRAYDHYPSHKSTPISLIDRMIMIMYNKINYIQKANLGNFNPKYDVIKYYDIEKKKKK